jgi:two-component system sensor histidine kinase RegB
MSDLFAMDFGHRARHLRVHTLVRLRWLAVGGQLLAIVVTSFGLGLPLPLSLCLAVIGASAVLNIACVIAFPPSARLADGPATAMLAFDILQLSALLFLTGGLANPFALLFLAPIMISAVSLPSLNLFALTFFMIVCATALALDHFALPWPAGETFALPSLYTAGIWMAITIGAVFTTLYASRVAREARQLADALAATELVLEREQHLSELDGLAAAAAHELGTPLATITLIGKDLAQQLPADSPLREDAALLNQEVGRCRTILSRLNTLDADADGWFDKLPVAELVEEIVAPNREFGARLIVDCAGRGPEPWFRRSPGLLYGLGNLVENAVDFAAGEVLLIARWAPGEGLSLAIEDDGPGFAPQVLPRLGDPYVTSKSDGRRVKSEGGGLGLGLFIAKTLLERSGATVAFTNRRARKPAPGSSSAGRIRRFCRSQAEFVTVSNENSATAVE